MLKARSAKAKGTRLEKWVSGELSSAGLRARRQPGSGIYSSFPHDVEMDMPRLGRTVIECKARKNGFATLERWLGKADLLIIKHDRQDPTVMVPWAYFKQMVQALSEHHGKD